MQATRLSHQIRHKGALPTAVPRRPGSIAQRVQQLPTAALSGAKLVMQPSVGGDWLPILTNSQRILDLICVGGAGLLNWALERAHLAGDTLTIYVWIVLFGALLAPFVLRDAKLDAPGEFTDGWRRSKQSLIGSVVLFGLVVLALFLADAATIVPRPILVDWFFWTALILIAQRALVAAYVAHLEHCGALSEMIAVVGAGPLADNLVDYFAKADDSTVSIIGIFDDRKLRGVQITNYPIGTLDDLLELGRNKRVDRVIITLPWSADDRILQLVRKLKSLAVDILLCPDRIGFNLPRRAVDGIGGLPLLCVASKPLARWNSLLKRIEDLLLGGLILVLMSPVMLMVAIAIRLESPGPILFRQRRFGFNNSEIEVFKFRSMRHAEADPTGAAQTRRDDERVTRVGKFIRRFSLDEVPQLLNVMRGEMSLVGPRPHPVGMRTGEQLGHEIVEDYAHRHRVKPGITGWAQVNGYRGATHTPEQLRMRVVYDLHYIEHWTLLFDLRILAVTIVKVLLDDAY